ncbi:MAG TPA: rhamnulokinase family protein [Vicinamibacterales bacterium]|jgi:rhamnulokinase|nr:rhamnulokinase family protein [Vicinamibacterales bacterium]
MHAAVDLGAGSGRVFLGDIRPDAARLEEVHRFRYAPRISDGHLRWDTAALFDGIQTGLRDAARIARASGARLATVGVDSWGVDYGLLDNEGHLVEEPIAYRDDRTVGMMEEVFARLPREEIFSKTGIQFLPLNTLYQLAAHSRKGLPARAARLLLMPDLCHHMLCGSLTSERTSASTTQLLNVRTGEWDEALAAAAGIPLSLLPELIDAGTDLGSVRAELGLGSPGVIAPATHDTASAVVGTPLEPGWAYISSGTWSLVGVELTEPLTHDEVLRANFTNERGVNGTLRFLTNVMGLWILESCRREWGMDAPEHLTTLLEAVASRRDENRTVFPDAPRFFNPRSMTAELRAALSEAGHQPADDPVFLTKVILDSLAARYASVVDTLETLTGRTIPGIHIVGGGSQNDYLNQATANAARRPVVAGPVEATALGNLLVQSLASGTISSIAEGRRAIASSLPLRRFQPTTNL